jgi:hypothetical protein
MKIISKVKDYYDYLSGINGIDPLVVYDRRNYVLLANRNESIPSDLVYQLDFEKRTGDKKKTLKYMWHSHRILYNEKYKNTPKSNNKKVLEGELYYMCLLVGFVKYVIECERYLDDSDKVCIDYKIIKKTEFGSTGSREQVCLYPFKEPVILYPCSCYNDYKIVYHGKTLYKDLRKVSEDEVRKMMIVNPILKDTALASLIPAEEVWSNIYAYLSALSEKDIVDTRTDDCHIVSHGFDLKDSFRNTEHRLD